MAFNRSKIQVLILAFIFALIPYFRNASCSCRFSSDAFRQAPSRKFVKEGEYVNFTCVAKNFNPFTDSIIWRFSPDLLNTDVTERYDTRSEDMISVITVHARRVPQFFSCELRFPKTRSCFSSQMVSMKVEYFPREEDLSCGPRNPPPLRVGDVMDIYCRVKRGNPGVDMSWKFVPEVPTVSLPLARDDSFQRVMSYDLSATMEMHQKSIVCDVTSEVVFPDRHLQCVIGPLLVHQTPSVSIHPIDVEIHYGKSAELTCVADGYPNVFNFSWTCEPEGAVTGCDSMTETATISLNRNFNNTVNRTILEISCTASNFLGRSTDSMHSNIIVYPRIHSETLLSNHVICPDDFELQISDISSSRNETNNSYNEFLVLCEVINVTQHKDIRILWKLGDRVLGESDFELPSFQNTSLISHLHLKNISRGEYGRSVTCMVTICNTSHTASVNLFRPLHEDNASGTNSLSNTHLTPGTVHEDLNSYSISTSSHSPRPPSHQFYNSSIFYHFDNFSSAQPSPSTSSPLRSTITVSFIGASGIVLIITCLAVFISFHVYRRLKKANQRKMNDFIREISWKYQISINDLNAIEDDHIYEVPRFESVLKYKENLSVDDHENKGSSLYSLSPCESRGKCSFYTNSSPSSSWSNSSGIYLDPMTNDALSELSQNEPGQDKAFHDVYANESAFPHPPEQGSRLFYKTRDLNTYPEARKILDIPMPAYPSKT